MTLLHLISHETLQNLLPMIGFRPARVLQMVSGDVRFHAKAQHIEDAYRLYEGATGVPEAERCVFLPVLLLNEKTPHLHDAVTAMQDPMRRYRDLCINFTGGTKMMSIGVYVTAGLAEEVEDKIPSFYCDTQAGKIVTGHTGGNFKEMRLGPLFRQLDVAMILAASGRLQGRDWQMQARSEAELEFGKTTFALMQHHQPYFRNYLRDMRGACTSSFSDGLLPPAPDGRIAAYLAQAAALDYVQEEPTGEYYLALPALKQKSRVTQDAYRKLQIDAALAKLDGMGFEYYVYCCVRNSTRYLKPVSSVEPVADIDSFGEMDILCLDTLRLGLTLISCKSSLWGANKLEHLEAMLRRKHELGGTFSQLILCVGERSNPHEKKQQALQQRCQTLGIMLLVGEEITQHFSEPLPPGTGQETASPHGAGAE